MFKSILNYIMSIGKSLVKKICISIIEKSKAIAKDKDIVNLALKAIDAAAKEGLTGEKAWVVARDKLTKALKEAGKELGDCAIDTTLQNTYAAYKEITTKKDI